MNSIKVDLKNALEELINNDQLLNYLESENWSGVGSVIHEVYTSSPMSSALTQLDFTESFLLLCLKSGISTKGYFEDNIPSMYFKGITTIDELKNEVRLPSHIKDIYTQAFSNTPFQKIILNEGLEYIGDLAFKGCSIVEIVLPKSVFHLGDYAFSNCELLIDITIPNTIKEMGSGIFSNCINLQTIIFTGTQKEALELGLFSYDVIGIKKRVQIKCTDGTLTYDGG